MRRAGASCESKPSLAYHEVHRQVRLAPGPPPDSSLVPVSFQPRPAGGGLAQYHRPMDCPARLRRGFPRPTLLALVPLTALGLTACAVPCIDDGLGQQFCPVTETETAGDTTPGTDTADDGTEVGDDGPDCPLLSVILIPQTPTMVLLVDQSGSMDADFGGATRWEVIRDVLVADGTGIVSQFAGGIRFGLSL